MHMYMCVSPAEVIWYKELSHLTPVYLLSVTNLQPFFLNQTTWVPRHGLSPVPDINFIQYFLFGVGLNLIHVWETCCLSFIQTLRVPLMKYTQ